MTNQTLSLWHELPMNMRPKVRYWLPAAAMDKDDLRAEIRDLCDRGFGGAEVVVLSMLPPEIAKSEEGWGTKRWDEMVDVIAETTKALGMTMDIANGPAWPISTPAVESADDPAALYELTWGELGVDGGSHYHGALPVPRTVHDEGTRKLVHVLAYAQLPADDPRVLAAAAIKPEKIVPWAQPQIRGVLVRESYIDLMPYINASDTLDFSFPELVRGQWKVFAFYSQPSCHKTNADQCFVIDHLSRAGAKACEKYWDEVLKDKHYDALESFFCDSLEYAVAMDWTPEFLQEFENRRGYSILPYLPFIGKADTFPACDIPGYLLEDKPLTDMVNADYMETLTQCYCENHLAALEEMANKYGKTIRYQVAYNKPFEVERSALFVGVPENEALGRPSVDFQKTMAAAAHLGRKERYSFECSAEFGHSYGQDYEDLLWWVKRGLMAGMNAQVLHGASYSGKYEGEFSVDGQIPGTQWPGFEAFGKFVSNYWNRTLSVKDARGCLDAITRMNMIFRTQPKVDCAVFRNTYGSDGLGGEFCLYDDGGALSNHGYNYETVTEYLLNLPVCRVSGHVLDAEGVGYKCLIIPPVKTISASCLLRLAELAHAGWPLIWVGEAPVSSQFFGEWDTEEKRQLWKKRLQEIWTMEGVTHVAAAREVPEALKALDILPEIVLDGGKDLLTAVRLDEQRRMKYFVLYGYNRLGYCPEAPNPDEASVSAVYKKGTVKGSYQRPGNTSRERIAVTLNGCGTVFVCNPWTGKMTAADFDCTKPGKMQGWLAIEEDEMVILAMDLNTAVSMPGTGGSESAGRYIPVTFKSLTLTSFEPQSEGEISFLRSGLSSDRRTFALSGTAAGLKPWREMDAGLEHFSGQGVYTAVVQIDALSDDARYILHLGHVCDTFSVCVNGQETDFPDQVMKRVDITELLTEGENQLQITVTSNLYNRLFSENMTSGPLKLAYVPRDYGIWESAGRNIMISVETCQVF